MFPVKLHLAYKSIKRLRAIISVMVTYGFYPLLESLRLTRLIAVHRRLAGKKTGAEREEPSMAVRLRLAFEELGPTFIKFGQILSSRPDIIPDEFIAELLKLQDEVRPFPFKDVARVIEKEFKAPLASVFSSIDETPVAAASIAQVHRAVTVEGREVVVKVQRPGIKDVIDTDIAILKYVARVMFKHIPESRVHDPVGVVDEFAKIIKREMDFTLEASYMEKFRANFADDASVEIPEVFWKHTRKRILTMSKVSGIKIDHVAELRGKGIATGKVAGLLMKVFFTQMFDHGLFHGDLHAGNILVRGEERLSLLDFGIVGRLDEDLKQHLADIFLGILNEDPASLARLYLKMGILPDDIDMAAFVREYGDITVHYFNRPLSYIRIGDLFMDHIRLVTAYRIKIPREFLLFSKCIVQLEGLVRVLDPEADIVKTCEPFAAQVVRKRLSPSAVISDGMTTLDDYRDLVNNVPVYTRRVFKKILSDDLSVQFVHRGLEDLLGEMDRSSNRLTFGIILAALVIGSSLIIAANAGPAVMGYPALGIIGFVIAGLLGLWLSFLILKSGKF
ncbi:MAG: ubiquinone biosynthesis protein UbiB [Deltaproteobacteria bacterium]|nr:ubiquinone biosynthesis protein UbiB [Deltaproteobacteria bacterium]